MIDRFPNLLFIKTHPACRIPLGIDIDEQNFLLCNCNGGREIDCRGRLTHSPFLIGNANHSRHSSDPDGLVEYWSHGIMGKK